MKKLKRLVVRHYLTVLAAIAVISLAVGLYGYGSTSFLSGFSAAEVQSIEQTKQFSDILANPLWLPYKLLLFLAQSVGVDAPQLRYISAFIALVTVGCFYGLCRKMHSERVSVLTTILFAVSSSLLTVSRTATPAIMLYSWIIATYCVVWFRGSKHTYIAPFVVALTTVVTLYIPGSFWFIGLLCLWFWKDIPKYWKHMSKSWSAAGIIVAAIILAPLIYSFYKDTNLIKSWLLIPSTFSMSATLTALKDIPAAFFYKAYANPSYNLGKLPLFDSLTGTMLLLGLYSYRERIRLERTIIYIVAVIVSVALASINANQLYLFFCLPFLYLFAAEGIHYLLTSWRSVFPRNPIAKIVGTTFMTIAVFAACSYHLNRYFLAWVNTPETKKIYDQKL